MRVASNIAASVQQAQTRERNDINRSYEKGVETKRKDDERLSNISDKHHNDKVNQIKEDIKNGNYKVNLMATADKMAQNLLNLQ